MDHVLLGPDVGLLVAGRRGQTPRRVWSDATLRTTDANFQYCIVGAPASTKMEVTLRNVAKNAYVREATNVTPSGLLIADQPTAANAQRFILQQRGPSRAVRSAL